MHIVFVLYGLRLQAEQCLPGNSTSIVIYVYVKFFLLRITWFLLTKVYIERAVHVNYCSYDFNYSSIPRTCYFFATIYQKRLVCTIIVHHGGILPSFLHK